MCLCPILACSANSVVVPKTEGKDLLLHLFESEFMIITHMVYSVVGSSCSVGIWTRE